MTSIFSNDLGKCDANYAPLSPVSFLKRSAAVYPEKIATAYGDVVQTYAQLHDRCSRFSSFLKSVGVTQDVAVSVMLPNIPAMIEMHFAVNGAGGVLHPINTKLDVEAIRFQVEHCEAKVIVFDREYADIVRQVIAGLSHGICAVEVIDPTQASPSVSLGQFDYETLIEQYLPDEHLGPQDEWNAIAVSFTSGTTGDPKGVVTHHRGAYLNATANAIGWSMPMHPVYLWTLPMFHCNGWCFPWTVTHLAGTHVCLRKIDGPEIFRLIDQYQVTHFCAAPIVLTLITSTDAPAKKPFAHRVQILTAGSAPAAATIQEMERLNAEVTQVYGLTETYSSVAISIWKPEWNDLPEADRYRRKARAGVRYPACGGLEVIVPGTSSPVPSDGQTVGEVVVRGNTVMSGYLKNRLATQDAFMDGWFHTGDLAVRDSEGYISIRGRSKDIIISGGENISSGEVEEVLYGHPSVLEAAVVGVDDAKWGEVPCAFLVLKPGANVSAQEVIEYCRSKLARFKVPKHVLFMAITRTATGKVQKFKLREIANEYLFGHASAG